jgi:signal transduction histidine kinase
MTPKMVDERRPQDYLIHRKNGRTGSTVHSGDETSTIKILNNQPTIQHVNERNAELEKQIEDLTIKLNEVSRTYSKFLSIIAHDLRSPFNAILITMELIKMKLENANKDELSNYVSIASESAVRTIHLLDDLMDWTISQNEHQSLHAVKVNLYEIIEEQIADVIMTVNQKKLSINHYISPDLNVSADLQMVKTIFRNLIGNAIKYTKAGGGITISTLPCKQFVKIVVSDTGIGISQEAQKRLFKMEMLQKTIGTNNERGSGFGLILCKELIEKHGGVLSLVSEEGKGSKFMFTLPHYI